MTNTGDGDIKSEKIQIDRYLLIIIILRFAGGHSLPI